MNVGNSQFGSSVAVLVAVFAQSPNKASTKQRLDERCSCLAFSLFSVGKSDALGRHCPGIFEPGFWRHLLWFVCGVITESAA